MGQAKQTAGTEHPPVIKKYLPTDTRGAELVFVSFFPVREVAASCSYMDHAPLRLDVWHEADVKPQLFSFLSRAVQHLALAGVRDVLVTVGVWCT